MLAASVATDGTPVSQLSPGSEKRVQLVCDACGHKSETVWHNYIQSQRKRGGTGETFCQPCVARQTGQSSKGKKNPKISAVNRQRFGKNHPCWKGGRYIDAHGYVMVNVKTGRNGKSGWSNYRKEHVVAMEQHLGRLLALNELVHHINGVKADNVLTNLWLATAKTHREAHQSLQLIGYALVRAGMVGFNLKIGQYYVADQKLRELLGPLDGGNQQPSLRGNSKKGSETRKRVPKGQ